MVETQAVVAGAAGDGCLVLSAVGGQVDGVIAFAAVHLQLRIGGGNAVSIVRLGAGDLRHRVGNGNLLFQAHIDAVKHNPDALDIDVAVNDYFACGIGMGCGFAVGHVRVLGFQNQGEVLMNLIRTVDAQVAAVGAVRQGNGNGFGICVHPRRSANHKIQCLIDCLLNHGSQRLGFCRRVSLAVFSGAVSSAGCPAGRSVGRSVGCPTGSTRVSFSAVPAVFRFRTALGAAFALLGLLVRLHHNGHIVLGFAVHNMLRNGDGSLLRLVRDIQRNVVGTGIRGRCRIRGRLRPTLLRGRSLFRLRL